MYVYFRTFEDQNEKIQKCFLLIFNEDIYQIAEMLPTNKRSFEEPSGQLYINLDSLSK